MYYIRLSRKFLPIYKQMLDAYIFCFILSYWFMYDSFVLLKQRKETFETIFILLPLLLYVSMLNL